MSNEEIIELARRMRAAQKAYYAEKFPGNKKPLLVAARQLESQLDKALASKPAGNQTEPFPTFPPPAPTHIA